MNSDELDTLISSIVKSESELAEESKHGWQHRSPPSICFNNCFPKSIAYDSSNWINLFPEYYWLNKKCEKLNNLIKRHYYKDESEHNYWLKLIQKYKEQMKFIKPSFQSIDSNQ